MKAGLSLATIMRSFQVSARRKAMSADPEGITGFSAGLFAERTSEELKVIDPTAERPVGIPHKSSADEVDPAVMAARATAAERQEALMEIHDLILTMRRNWPSWHSAAADLPTAMVAPDHSIAICREEILGPFATIQVFDDEDEVIARANDSKFGLVGYAWSGNLKRAMRTAGALRTATVMVNMPIVRDLRTGFGGYKQSGLGREAQGLAGDVAR